MLVNPNPQQLWIRLWEAGSAIKKKKFPNKLGRYVNKNQTQMMCKWSEHHNLSKILERHQTWHWWILHHYGTPTFTGHRVVKVPLCNCFTFPHVPIASHNLVLYPFFSHFVPYRMCCILHDHTLQIQSLHGLMQICCFQVTFTLFSQHVRCNRLPVARGLLWQSNTMFI